MLPNLSGLACIAGVDPAHLRFDSIQKYRVYSWSKRYERDDPGSAIRGSGFCSMYACVMGAVMLGQVSMLNKFNDFKHLREHLVRTLHTDVINKIGVEKWEADYLTWVMQNPKEVDLIQGEAIVKLLAHMLQLNLCVINGDANGERSSFGDSTAPQIFIYTVDGHSELLSASIGENHRLPYSRWSNAMWADDVSPNAHRFAGQDMRYFAAASVLDAKRILSDPP